MNCENLVDPYAIASVILCSTRVLIPNGFALNGALGFCFPGFGSGMVFGANDRGAESWPVQRQILGSFP